jgi:hypothetical protein
VNDRAESATFDSLFADRCLPYAAPAGTACATRGEIRNLMKAVRAAELFVIV